jgi:acyl dehydratase
MGTGEARRVRFFEDYGPIAVSEAEVLEFARRYDPQPFHADPAAARGGPFGGLIASGWHTAAMMMRVLVENYFSAESSLGSPGIDELRWTRPVRPGDRLRVRVTILEAKRSRSKPDRGLVRARVEVLNQDGEVAMSLLPMNLILARDRSTSPLPLVGGDGGRPIPER